MIKTSLPSGSPLIKEVKFLEDYMIRKGYSSKTIKSYLSHFANYLVFSKGDNEVTTVNNYMLHLIKVRKCSYSHCNQVINAIKLYAKISNRIDYKKFAFYPRPKTEVKLPKVLGQEEVKVLFEQVNNKKHKCELMIAYSCGLRVSEVANLKVTDIDSIRMIVIIRQSKGRKDRITTLSIKMLEELRSYYIEYQPKVWLFENPTKDGPISSRTLQVIFNRAKNKAGIRKSATFHSLRHSYATHLLESGVDLRFIQELLGHANSKTTERYTHVSTRSIQNIPNPLDNL